MSADPKSVLLKVLQDRPIAYRPGMAKAVKSVTAGVFISQLFYWSDKGSDENGWIYKTQKEWYNETGLSRRNQETARKSLLKLRVISERLSGNPARLYYKINFDEFMELLSRMYGSDNLECTVQTNKNAQSEQAKMPGSDILSLTENTTEINTATTTDIYKSPKESLNPYNLISSKKTPKLSKSRPIDNINLEVLNAL